MRTGFTFTLDTRHFAPYQSEMDAEIAAVRLLCFRNTREIQAERRTQLLPYCDAARWGLPRRTSIPNIGPYTLMP